MNIVFIGMRGSGKSTVGKHLSEQISWQFLETDKEIEKAAGKKIREIVKDSGWEYFRNLETKIIENCGQLDKTVIAAGGGAVVRAGNIRILKKNGFIIYLTAPLRILSERIKGDNNRPSLTDCKTTGEEMREIFYQRRNLYKKAADCFLSTANKKQSEIVNYIHNLLISKKIL